MKKSRVRMILLLIAVASILLTVSILALSKRSDCTEAYSVYKEVKNLTTVDSVLEHLQKEKIEYTIKDSTLTLNKYNSISFRITNNEDCSIKKCELMECLEILDKSDYNVIKVTGKVDKDSGKIMEKFSYFTILESVEKSGNSYYFVPNQLAFFLLCSVAILLYFLAIIMFVPRAIKQKAPKAQMVPEY